MDCAHQCDVRLQRRKIRESVTGTDGACVDSSHVYKLGTHFIQWISRSEDHISPDIIAAKTDTLLNKVGAVAVTGLSRGGGVHCGISARTTRQGRVCSGPGEGAQGRVCSGPGGGAQGRVCRGVQGCRTCTCRRSRRWPPRV